MSMLAERKRKTKWTINPTKKPLWNEDSSGIKFGKELMEKMGWSVGKGLGVREQGIHEPLKVSYKNDTKGMGFKGTDDNWIEHQDEFNLLLSQLSKSNNENTVKTSEIKSLEDKSKHSKARVHYHKFTRGKDLSKYSENDLACILGLNKTKKEKFKLEEETLTESNKNPNGECETSFGVTTVYGGSLKDYFSKKWIYNKIKSGNLLKSTDEAEDFNKSTSESNAAFLICKEEENEKLEIEEKKNKKKKHKTEVQNIHQNIICSGTEDIKNSVDKTCDLSLIVNENEEKNYKKRKLGSKFKSGFSDARETEKLEINNFSELKYEKKNKKKKKSKGIETISEEIKIKKKKINNDESDNACENEVQTAGEIENSQCLPSVLNENNIKVQVEEKKPKKEKRKSKSESEEIIVTENPNQDEILALSGKNLESTNFGAVISENHQIKDFENLQTELNEKRDKKICKEKNELSLLEKKQKHKKKRKTSSDEYKFLEESQMDNPNKEEKSQNLYCEEFSCAIPGEYNMKSIIREMKYKRKKCESRPEEEISFGFTESATNDVVEVITETEKKKIKKRKHTSVSETEPVEKKDFENFENDEYLEKQRREKKKKKKNYLDDCDVISNSETNTLKDSESIITADLDYKAFESLENQNISSAKKHKKETKEKEIYEKEFERSVKKQKLNFGECEQGILSSELKNKEMKEALLDVSVLKTNIEINKNEISDSKQTDKKKKKMIEKENKWRVNENPERKEANFCNTESAEVESKISENSKKNKTVNGEGVENGICTSFTVKKPLEVSEIITTETVNMKSEVIKVNKEVSYGKYKPRTYTSEKVLDLIRWADIKKFRGSNLGNVLGYGFKQEYLKDTLC